MAPHRGIRAHAPGPAPHPRRRTQVPAVPDGPTDEELAKAAEIKKARWTIWETRTRNARTACVGLKRPMLDLSRRSATQFPQDLLSWNCNNHKANKAI